MTGPHDINGAQPASPSADVVLGEHAAGLSPTHPQEVNMNPQQSSGVQPAAGLSPTPVQLAIRFETATLTRQLAQLAWAVENVPGVAGQLGAMLPFAPIVHQRDSWTCVNQAKELVIELQLAEAYRPLLLPQPSPDVPAPAPAEPALQPSAEAGQQFVTRQELAVQLARLQTRIEQRLRTGAIL